MAFLTSFGAFLPDGTAAVFVPSALAHAETDAPSAAAMVSASQLAEVGTGSGAVHDVKPPGVPIGAAESPFSNFAMRAGVPS